MLDYFLDTFNIKPEYDLNIMKQGQTIGDITTTFAGTLAAFYQQVAIGHVEAGLRTSDKYSPYPEEMNRQMIDCMIDMYFAPTSLSKQNLLDENKIYITANTAIDAMATTVKDDYTNPE